MKTVNQSLYHIVIASNGARRFLTRVNQDILFNYITGMLFNRSCKPIKVGGHSEHVHILLSIAPHIPLLQLIKEIQQNSLDFLRRENSVFPEFTGWDSNYVAYSHHISQVDELSTMIKNQYEIHRSISFEEELEILLTKKTT